MSHMIDHVQLTLLSGPKRKEIEDWKWGHHRDVLKQHFAHYCTGRSMVDDG